MLLIPVFSGVNVGVCKAVMSMFRYDRLVAYKPHPYFRIVIPYGLLQGRVKPAPTSFRYSYSTPVHCIALSAMLPQVIGAQCTNPRVGG